MSMGNPFGIKPMPAGAMTGMGYSGPQTEVFPDGHPQQVLKISLKEVQPAGYHGLSSVHVFAADKTPAPFDINLPPNQMLLLDVSWQSGLAGGQATIDATRGTFFTVSGSAAITINARLVSSIEGEPIFPWSSKLVEASVHWGTSISPKSAMVTTPTQLLAFPDFISDYIPIPQQATSMIALTSEPVFLPGLVANFFTSNLHPAEVALKYKTINPNANGTPIVHGVEFVRFTQRDAEEMRVFPTFELWL